MNIIQKIITWFKNMFISSYKSVADDIDNDNLHVETSANMIKIRNCVKSYMFKDIVITINDNMVMLPEVLKYKEEYVIETNAQVPINFKITLNLKCEDGVEEIKNLSYCDEYSEKVNIVNITDKMLGLIPISFSASVEDFTPLKTTSIKI